MISLCGGNIGSYAGTEKLSGKYLGKLPLGSEISGMRKIIKITRIGKNAAGIKDNRCVGLEA